MADHWPVSIRPWRSLCLVLFCVASKVVGITTKFVCFRASLFWMKRHCSMLSFLSLWLKSAGIDTSWHKMADGHRRQVYFWRWLSVQMNWDWSWARMFEVLKWLVWPEKEKWWSSIDDTAVFGGKVTAMLSRWFQCGQFWSDAHHWPWTTSAWLGWWAVWYGGT